MTEFKTKNYIKEIKSNYIKSQFFSFLNKKQFLNVINYNKELQQIFGVNIEDYKKISGKYIICENGKGKEYTLENKLVFEGEYLNGKRNGKGKEYYLDGDLKFEGEYLNREIWNGKGKKYYPNGELKFEGEYLNGKKKWKWKRI